MNTPLFLELRKTRSKSAHFKYLYQVIYQDEVIAEKRSRKDFVACYVTVKDIKFKFVDRVKYQQYIFEAPYFFEKSIMIGKGISSKVEPFAIALSWDYLHKISQTDIIQIFVYTKFNNDL